MIRNRGEECRSPQSDRLIVRSECAPRRHDAASGPQKTLLIFEVREREGLGVVGFFKVDCHVRSAADLNLLSHNAFTALRQVIALLLLNKENSPNLRCERPVVQRWLGDFSECPRSPRAHGCRRAFRTKTPRGVVVVRRARGGLFAI